MLRYVPFIPILVRFCFYHEWVLNFVKYFFCIYWDDLVVFLKSWIPHDIFETTDSVLKLPTSRDFSCEIFFFTHFQMDILWLAAKIILIDKNVMISILLHWCVSSGQKIILLITAVETERSCSLICWKSSLVQFCSFQLSAFPPHCPC